jgi:hypothetical protein
LKREFNQHSNTLKVEKLWGLERIHVLVGDLKPEIWFGPTVLVRMSAVSRKKLYE